MSARVRSTESCASCNRSYYVDDGKGEQRQYICGECGTCMTCASAADEEIAKAVAFLKAIARKGNPSRPSDTWAWHYAEKLERREHR